MERQWGDLDKYRGISTSSKGARTLELLSLCSNASQLCSLSCCLQLYLCASMTLLLKPTTVLCRAGNYVVGGVQLGNVWIGVQPALGLEGDPMRLLFERDLTPHPQYAGEQLPYHTCWRCA